MDQALFEMEVVCHGGGLIEGRRVHWMALFLPSHVKLGVGRPYATDARR